MSETKGGRKTKKRERERERERMRMRIAQQIDPTEKADGLWGERIFLTSISTELPFACESNSLRKR